MSEKNYNKVIYNGKTLIDLTEDSVDPAVLVKGYTAHDKSGNIIEGEHDGMVASVSDTVDENGEYTGSTLSISSLSGVVRVSNTGKINLSNK